MYHMLYQVLDIAFQALYIALLVRVALSWIPHNQYHPIIQYLYRVTDPILKPFQNIVPPWKIGFDLSPIFAFFALSILRRLIFLVLF